MRRSINDQIWLSVQYPKHLSWACQAVKSRTEIPGATCIGISFLLKFCVMTTWITSLASRSWPLPLGNANGNWKWHIWQICDIVTNTSNYHTQSVIVVILIMILVSANHPVSDTLSHTVMMFETVCCMSVCESRQLHLTRLGVKTRDKTDLNLNKVQAKAQVTVSISAQIFFPCNRL